MQSQLQVLQLIHYLVEPMILCSDLQTCGAVPAGLLHLLAYYR